MFDFEKLEVYSKAKAFNLFVFKFISKTTLDSSIKGQLRRAAMSISLNIAEGSGRNSKADKKHYMIMARGSVFECVAFLI